jgi:hypothetical protein
MLLEASEQRIHVRRQLRYWLLLSLRVLLFGLLAVAFAKPVLERPPVALAAAPPTLNLIVIDTSLSMGHGDRMARARSAAMDIIGNAGANDRLQLITAGNTATVRVSATRDRTVITSAVASLTSGRERADLGVLIRGLGGLVDPVLEANEKIVVHLISDLQISGLPTRFADLVPEFISGRSVGLTLHPVAIGPSDNWAIESARVSPDGVEVGVRSFAAAGRSKTVTLILNGETLDAQTQVVAAAGQSVFRFPPADLTSGDNRLVARLTPADELAGDDARFTVIDNAPPAPVLILTADTGSLPVTYLTTALASIPRGYAAEVVALADLDPRVLVRYPWLVIDDLGVVNDRLAAAITDYLNAGGNVLAGLGDAALARRELPVTGHPVSGDTASIAGLRSVTRVEASHPTLAATRGWRAVSVARALPLTLSQADRVLVQLGDGQPLLLEREIGAGRLLLLTTRLDSAWSDLPVQPVFVNFMAEAARYLSGEDRLERQQTAGSSLILRQSGAVSGQVIDPDGREILALADTRRGADIRLRKTGFYEVYTPGADTLVAVNPDLRESDLATMTENAQADWQNLLASPGSATGEGEAMVMKPVPLPLWQGVLALLAAVVLAESLLGNGYLGQRRGAS